MLNLVQPPSEGTHPNPALAAFADHMRRAALLWIAYEDELIPEGHRFRQIAGTENFDRAAQILDELLEQGTDSDAAKAMLAGRQPVIPAQRLALVTS